MQNLLLVANMTEFISGYVPLKLQSHCTGLLSTLITTEYDSDKLMRTLRYVTP